MSAHDTAEDKKDDREDDRELHNRVKDVFQKYNKKFNKTTKNNDSMESRSFRHLTEGITCLKHIKRQDKIKIFDEQSTEGSQVLNFEQFIHALKRLGALEVEYRGQVAKSADQVPPEDDMYVEIFNYVKELNPNSCKEFVRSGFNFLINGESTITSLTKAAGNALKVIGRATVRELATVGTTIAWIGPAVKLLEVIWNQIIAFEEIPDVLEKFGEMLLYLTDTVEFIDTEKLYHTDMMQRRIDGLVKVLKRAKEHFKKVEMCNSVKLRKFFSAKENKELLKDLEDDLSKWITLTYFVQLAENQEGTNALDTKLGKLQKDEEERHQENQERIAALEKVIDEFCKEYRVNWEKFMEKQNIKISFVEVADNHVLAGGSACVDRMDIAVLPRVEHDNPTQTAGTRSCMDADNHVSAGGSAIVDRTDIAGPVGVKHDDPSQTAGTKSRMDGDNHVLVAGGCAILDRTDFAVPTGVEHDNPTQTARTNIAKFHMDVEYLLPPELRKSNSDFLIYHAYEDSDKAMALKENLLRKMPKLCLSKNGDDIVEVRIQILDEFRSSGVRQENLEDAVKSCSVKLLLVTERFVLLKGDGGHSLEIFKILADSRSGEVFALRNDPDYNSYLRKLDFYVQGLMQGAFYDPNDSNFSDKMTDIFKRRVKLRIDRDKELEQKQKRALILEKAREKEKKRKEEKHMNTLQQNINEIMEKVTEAESEEEKDMWSKKLEELQL